MRYKLCFYVPEEAAESVKEAAFNAGGGRIGNYDRCCWQVAGLGQFRPLAGSQPYVGEQGQVEYVSELRVEMLCEGQCVEDVIRAMKQAHPYEEPAYDVVRIEPVDAGN